MRAFACQAVLLPALARGTGNFDQWEHAATPCNRVTKIIPCSGTATNRPASILIEPILPIPLLVLDTNVVLDWVAFDDARVQPIAAAIERGALRTVTSGACLQELRRALGYAQVKLDSGGAGARVRALRRARDGVRNP